MEVLLLCERCGEPYHEAKSRAGLRLSYCTQMCEGIDNGMTIRDWLNVRRAPDAVRAKALMREFHLKSLHERAESYRAFFEEMKKAGAI